MESCSRKKRIGVIGGSFDPVHVGHLMIAQDALERLNLTEVVFVPAAMAPHKQHVQQVEATHRLTMLQMAVETDGHFSVSDMEIDRGGVSYTVDTLDAFKILYGDHDLYLIVGSDTLVDLHTWYKIDRILELCKIATLLRPGEDFDSGMAEKIDLPTESKRELLKNVIHAHQIEVSSTEIRQRVSRGVSIRYLVPDRVAHYIKEQGLYKNGRGKNESRS